MFKLSSVLNRNVISLFEAQNVGEVSGVLLDKSLNKIRYFAVINHSQNDTELFFPPTLITNVSNDAVTIKNLSKTSSRSDIPPIYVKVIVGASVFSFLGKDYGKISDIEIDEQGKIINFVTPQLTFAPSKILSHSIDLLIINDTDQKVRLPRPCVKKVSSPVPPPTPTVTVSATETLIQPKATSLPEVEPSLISSIEPIAPPKATAIVSHSPLTSPQENTSYDFLLGRTAQKNILADDDTLIIAQSQIIDSSILSLARKYDKLVHLALHSK